MRNSRSADSAAGVDDPRLLSYRSWALQSDLGAGLDAAAGWRRATDLGVEQPADAEAGGQGELLRELEPDPELSLRTRTSLLLWGTALVTDVFNQVGPIGVRMSDDAFAFTVGGVIAAIVFTAIVYPRLAARPFAVVEQVMLSFAFVLITFQCSDTGGVESPYMVWWLFTAFYAAHFFPARRMYMNLVAMTGLAMLPLAYDDTAFQTDALTLLTLLIALLWTLSATIHAGRELERGAERAARFTALADPLTGVANLRAFEQTVDLATRGGQPEFGLVLVDMHGLKGANAAFGVEAGDDMLIRLSGLMRHASSARDQVARMRGEEFAVYLPGAGPGEVEAWCERFRGVVSEHNAWVRNRLPQISVTLGSAVCPVDGARASQLFERSDRRLEAERSAEVRPPHEVNISTVARADRLLGRPEPETRRRINGFVGATQQLGVRWAFGTALFAAYALSGGDALRYPGLLAAVAGVCLIVSAICFALRGTRYDRTAARISDVASIVLVVPILWSTSGWQSPLLLTVFFPVVYYGQFLRGRQAYARSGALISTFTFAFWAGPAFGVAESPVSPSGETLYATSLAALLVLTLIIQHSHGVAADALTRIRESASHDPLTGLGNALAFREHLRALIEIAERRPEPDANAPVSVAGPLPQPAITIADIDDFRGLINRNGHKTADETLLAVAARLRSAVGDLAAAYHIERDEFAVIFKSESHDQAVAVTERVQHAILGDAESEPRLPVPVRFSFGTAVWRPGITVAQLVDEASEHLAAMRAARGEDPTGGGAVLL